MQLPTLPIALSPCPNDTFLIHAWAHGLIESPLSCNLHFGDIEQLNTWALEGRYPVTKVSIGLLPHIQDTYQLLPVGVALGRNAGPLIIAKKPFLLEDLAQKKVAIPGRHTTANLLLDLLQIPCLEKIEVLYSEILNQVEREEVDAGLIIHESRFLYQERGYVAIADLGQLFERAFHCPVPLGGYVAKKSMALEERNEIAALLQRSLSYAWQNPERSASFVLEHSQEKDPLIIQKHIDLFVSADTHTLSLEGQKALSHFL
ncbi:MAG: hypothetical protein K0S07_1479 [Chlamydiales bacterium]|jgi:1,4-dihydroxy-6-naphthoate synthase|nr:hypothetical protein [Chlamydiales bacterium]